MLNINKLFDFQNDCVNWILNKVSDSKSKEILTIKSPTGSGKTVILLAFIEQYLQTNPNTSFIWFCPGKGNLEEQSKAKMEKYLPHYDSCNLADVLLNGFKSESVTFINWELVTKKDNKAITDSEKKNIFDAIREANLDKREFIIIIDEEHSNDTKKANDIINAFTAKHIIRASATTKKNKNAEFYEIDEIDVIDEELITKAVFVNEDIDESKANVLTEYEYLIDMAEVKRKEIAKAYTGLGVNVRPLVLIQMPNKSDALLDKIEGYLSNLGYTYENKMVAKWLDKSKKNIENIEKINAEPIFMIIKQAVATGWDCPRAKILIKLREDMGDVFTIQTIGRIRRMPEQKFYAKEVLNYAYIYTFDNTYKQGLLGDLDNAYTPTRFYLKDKCKDFSIKSQKRGDFIENIDEREVREKIYDYFMKTYSLGSDILINEKKLKDSGYEFAGQKRKSKILKQKVIKTESIGQSSEDYVTVYRDVSTHADGRDKMHSVNEIAVASGMNYNLVNIILLFMFKHNKKRKHKILKMKVKEYYAFIINNKDKLKDDFRNASSVTVSQTAIKLVKHNTFSIPHEELYPADNNDTHKKVLNSNAYKDYNSSLFVKRSMPEILFEKWCDNNSNIDWCYKNGNKGPNYLSVVYINGINKQHEFYPDYIVKMNSGNVWIIETKGGENSKGENKNIDKQIENKFNAFKEYADKNNIKWGFVRDKNGELYINNTIYNDDLNDSEWKNIQDIIE